MMLEMDASVVACNVAVTMGGVISFRSWGFLPRAIFVVEEISTDCFEARGTDC